jgi:hypothetical protein
MPNFGENCCFHLQGRVYPELDAALSTFASPFIIIQFKLNQPTRCNSFTSLLLDVHVWLNMFRALSRPSSGAHNCISSLWFHRWIVVVAALFSRRLAGYFI